MSPFLNIAFRAAREAGNLMLRSFKNLDSIRVERKAANDFVTEIDRQSERILIEQILTAYPHHVIRAEEGGYYATQKTASGELAIQQIDTPQQAPTYEWIIDPLDGTTNYLHGLPHYAMSVALRQRGVLTNALVFAPELNDLYTAEKDNGATLNNRRIRVAKTTRLEESLSTTGFPVVDHSVDDAYLAILKNVINQTAGARRYGSAALDLCYVADGHFDGFFEFNLKAWDIAAGALIVKESGGYVSDFLGEEDYLTTGNICAGNAQIHGFLLKIIQEQLKNDDLTDSAA